MRKLMIVFSIFILACQTEDKVSSNINLSITNYRDSFILNFTPPVYFDAHISSIEYSCVQNFRKTFFFNKIDSSEFQRETGNFGNFHPFFYHSLDSPNFKIEYIEVSQDLTDKSFYENQAIFSHEIDKIQEENNRQNNKNLTFNNLEIHELNNDFKLITYNTYHNKLNRFSYQANINNGVDCITLNYVQQNFIDSLKIERIKESFKNISIQ